MTKYSKEQLHKMKDKMTVIEKKLDILVNKIKTSDETANIYWSQINRDVKKVYEEMRVVFKTHFTKSVDNEYYEELNKEVQRLKGKKFKTSIKVNYSDVENSFSNTQSVSAILNDGLSSFFIGSQSGEKTLNRFIMQTQQILVSEKKVNQLIEDGFFTEDSKGRAKRTKSAARKALQEEFTKKYGENKFITVINKNGKEMKFRPKYYADMVARTKLIECNSIAAVNTALDVGSDLVQVSSHNTPTPLCQEFEGKIYSISGNDKDFPMLEEIPPYHPNCRHSLSVVIREALEMDGIGKYSDFSKGITEDHPTRQSHIPVSQRGEVE